MKTVVLIRHAKAAKSGSGTTDADRPLTERGENDARQAGARLKSRGIVPDRLFVSPALRARQSAERLADTLGLATDRITPEPMLYKASATDLERFVEGLSDDVETVGLVGHNPTFTEFANRIGSEPVDNIPAGGVYAVTFPTDTWAEAVTAVPGTTVYARGPKDV